MIELIGVHPAAKGQVGGLRILLLSAIGVSGVRKGCGMEKSSPPADATPPTPKDTFA
jgi:hypothetical protein